MVTYLSIIEDILEYSTLHNTNETFRTIRKKMKQVVRDRTGKSYNNRAYVSAIRRGILAGRLKRTPDGCIVTHSLDMPQQSLPHENGMCENYRASVEHCRERRMDFVATVGRRGYKRGSKGVITVLLTHIRPVHGDESVHIEHAWVAEGRSFVPFVTGDRVQFNARVRLYHKAAGLDYQLFYPTKVRHAPIPTPP